MLKLNLQDSFKEFCKKNKFEINNEQVQVIELISKFLKSDRSFIRVIFK